jgi:hypothetical protein
MAPNTIAQGAKPPSNQAGLTLWPHVVHLAEQRRVDALRPQHRHHLVARGGSGAAEKVRAAPGLRRLFNRKDGLDPA